MTHRLLSSDTVPRSQLGQPACLWKVHRIQRWRIRQTLMMILAPCELRPGITCVFVARIESELGNKYRLRESMRLMLVRRQHRLLGAARSIFHRRDRCVSLGRKRERERERDVLRRNDFILASRRRLLVASDRADEFHRHLSDRGTCRRLHPRM